MQTVDGLELAENAWKAVTNTQPIKASKTLSRSTKVTELSILYTAL
ncbi:hypothetical protein [Desulfurococcus amylolyticus]|uniref:Uncharacterized protein n=1 Tax=Desulfurococcus amylolyticus DSM 16532 TaxID=768672 RepID=I3XSI5_DESAM|nr:hypothetical protein [Desulfurococcus amylolyticus]AFL66909.1 hypothetical protein Desfe_1029 [Desulfurococcus amylolyticus DSM 16532]